MKEKTMETLSELISAKVTAEEKAAVECAAQRMGTTVSDLIRRALRAWLDRPAPRALEKAEMIVRDVESRYAPLIERVENEIADAREKLSRLEEESCRLTSEIEKLSAPPSLEETPDEIARKIEELAAKKALRDAVGLKVTQLRTYLTELTARERKLLGRRERQKILGLKGALPDVLNEILGHLINEISDGAKGLAPFVRALADKERPQTIWRWIWFYLGWQLRDISPEAWDLVGRPQPLIASSYENFDSFLRLLERFCGPLGPSAELNEVDEAGGTTITRA